MSQQTSNIPSLTIGKHTAEVPIIQGGMGVGISMSGLASAVAEAGGIGVLSTVAIGILDGSKKFKQSNEDTIKDQIRKAKKATNGVVGCNIMVAISDYDNLIECAVKEQVDILFLGAGLPLRFPEGYTPDKLKETNTAIVPIVSSAKAAKLIFQFWEKKYNTLPDGVVVEGPMAGGHLGFKNDEIDSPNKTLENIIPGVVSTVRKFETKNNVSIPIIAAGGIYTGDDINKFFKLGAKGVQLGTRFVATHECDADIRFKEAYIKANKEDITIIKSPVGLPGRAINNEFLEQVSAGERKPFKCPWKCLKTCDYKTAPYCIAAALSNAKKGNLDSGFVFAGSNAYRITEIISVKELIDAMTDEYIIAAGLPEKKAQ
ncbi:MAG: nitronate monooxygenase [Deltaproteobacteria bacterium]|jgi:nitronate monooxygenase|nr:nitronate monooxygenase [Deltaproteobacteria bacterium]MBT4527170.1 nitronate monooxygenase [Deltaproteobacteria bacterium]